MFGVCCLTKTRRSSHASSFFGWQVPIFIAGESLGGALSILLGLSLQESNVSMYVFFLCAALRPCR